MDPGMQGFWMNALLQLS